MIAALRDRDWEGDDVLADQLDALLGSGVMSDLRPLPADLDELAGILAGRPGVRRRARRLGDRRGLAGSSRRLRPGDRAKG